MKTISASIQEHRERSVRVGSDSGFTLAELMIAMAIAGVVLAGLAQFTLSTSRVLFDSTAKLRMAEDTRQFTSDISRTGRSARAFYIYPDYGSTPVVGDRVQTGRTGDLLVFIWIDPDRSGGTVPDYNKNYYSRIVCYGRTSGEDGYGEVVRFDRHLSPSSFSEVTAENTVEKLIISTLASPETERRTVVQLARGLADQRLFVNYRDGSVVVNGQIQHGNANRTVTNTYNFTITPRG